MTDASWKQDKFWSEYPELFHYTSPAGLEGILWTQTLRATHVGFLNDITEFRLFHRELPEYLTPAIEKALSAHAEGSVEYQQELEQEGGVSVVAIKLVQELLGPMYASLLDEEGTESYFDFFITSFCLPSNEEKVNRHGLLSQWRGYGQGGGCALVFDTVGFQELLDNETSRWQCQITFGNVVYSHAARETILAEFGDHIEKLSRAFEELIRTKLSPKFFEDSLLPFVSCLSRYKHWGFHEKKEVRLITTVNGERIQNETSPAENEKPEKPRHHFNRNDVAVPCLYLFETATESRKKLLPITKIIVGPHRDQESRYRGIKSLVAELGLADRIGVTRSEIPHVG